MKRSLVFFIAALVSVHAGAETMDNYIEKKKTIEAKEQTRSELALDVAIAELKYELENVGKEDSANNDSDQQQQNMNFNNRTFLSGEQRSSEPTWEARAEARKNQVLDNMNISSVYPSKRGGKLVADLVSRNDGRSLSVSVGDVVGNFKVTEVTLASVKADHISLDDSRVIQ